MKTKLEATRRVAGIMAIAIIALAIIGCKQEPTPVEQKLSVAVGSATVEIKFMALPNTTPSYISKLQQALSWIGTNEDFGTRTGALTINVISGNTAPAKGVTKTLDVGTGWLSTTSAENIYGALTAAGVIPNWFTMIKALKLA
jgi:hypothetical protein